MNMITVDVMMFRMLREKRGEARDVIRGEHVISTILSALRDNNITFNNSL